MSAAHRMPGKGLLIDRSRPLRFRFDGRGYEGFAGDTLASALLANGTRLMGRSFKYHRPRGVMTAGTEEPSALVEVHEGAQQTPNVRATVQEIYEGLDARSQNHLGPLGFDLLAVNDYEIRNELVHQFGFERLSAERRARSFFVDKEHDLMVVQDVQLAQVFENDVEIHVGVNRNEVIASALTFLDNLHFADETLAARKEVFEKVSELVDFAFALYVHSRSGFDCFAFRVFHRQIARKRNVAGVDETRAFDGYLLNSALALREQPSREHKQRENYQGDLPGC